MKKHAYLILAHNEFEGLKRLLSQLDDERNDIYLHIDKKVKDIDFDEIASSVTKSKVFFVKRRNVIWGEFTIALAQLDLLKAAVENDHYHYYHGISGVDFPIKSQDYIHDFLENEDRQFVWGYKNGDREEDFMWKVQYYHLFVRWVGRADYEGNTLSERFKLILNKIRFKAVACQKKLGVNRWRKVNPDEIYKGSNWFTITDDFARYIVGMERKLRRKFSMTYCGDEFFLQYALVNSPYKDKMAFDDLRAVDWERGNPYEWTIDDLDELRESPKLFARKLSFQRQPELYDALSEKK